MRRQRLGFSLIELLVVIAIIGLLLAILLPVMSMAREEGKKAVCMSNLRQIGFGVAMYLEKDNNLPWTYVHRLTNGQPQLHPDTITNNYSSYTWGGMKASNPWPGEETADWATVPPEVRPLNRLLAADARDDDKIGVMQCPGDRSAVSPVVLQNQNPLSLEQYRSSWQAFGNSYSINWFFMEHIARSGQADFNLENLFKFGKRVLRKNSGPEASRFVLMWENQVDQLFVEADITGGGRLGAGWHRNYSNHTFLFLDGHVDHRYFDTRALGGDGWRVYDQ
ncbi:MAG: DUF1559 domain-containing protein [Phycisphaerales bacterium]|nr:DUF1559 domain-containing protein [Phycisphaerales bacterium]